MHLGCQIRVLISDLSTYKSDLLKNLLIAFEHYYLHVYIIILHVHIKSYVDIINLACRGQKYSTIYLVFCILSVQYDKTFVVRHCFDYLMNYYNNYIIITTWSNSPEFSHVLTYNLLLMLQNYFHNADSSSIFYSENRFLSCWIPIRYIVWIILND